jgi:putative membrane protein
MKNRKLSWKEAFMASPGPKTLKATVGLSLKGLCMGTADIIPGVSGGTIALITGIYQQLLQAIKSFDSNMARSLLKLDFKTALAGLHLRFLMALFLGIGVAIISLARLVNYLLQVHPVFIWSFFFGLIVASVIVVGRHVSRWSPGAGTCFCAGGLLAWLIVNAVPVATPETAGFIFFSGLVAICAMILPGISGAFILLILGKYEFITGSLKNPFLVDNFITIAVFCAGCFAGLVGFSRVLNVLLNRYYNATIAFLTGLMAGSLPRIWPWKEVVETRMIRGKAHVIQVKNILPDGVDGAFFLAVGLAVAGFVIVIWLERAAEGGEPGE